MPVGKNKNKAASATAPTLPKTLNPIIYSSMNYAQPSLTHPPTYNPILIGDVAEIHS
jgi:hypothetical protein